MAESELKKCSKCGGEIRPCVFLGVALQNCPNCGGFFLDSKYIQKNIALAQSDTHSDKREDSSALDKAFMVCPDCQCSMAKKNLSERESLFWMFAHPVMVFGSMLVNMRNTAVLTPKQYPMWKRIRLIFSVRYVIRY